MSYLITHHGNRIDMPRPRQDQITIGDIAAHLARLPRFVGATRRPYSVAMHSMHVMMLAKDSGAGDTLQMAALLHDAHEAYMGDIPSPVKAWCGPALKEFEDNLQHAVLARFGLTTVYETCRAEIKNWDLIALATERRDLMHHAAMQAPWEVLKGIEPDRHHISPWISSSPSFIEAAFLNWFNRLRPTVFPQ